MKVVDLADIVRRETPLLYRRTYTARATLSDRTGHDHVVTVEFVLEHSPLGPVTVTVKLVDEIDYPLVPVISALKSHIKTLEESGDLP